MLVALKRTLSKLEAGTVRGGEPSEGENRLTTAGVEGARHLRVPTVGVVRTWRVGMWMANPA